MSGEGEGEAGRHLQVEHVRVRGRDWVRVSDLQVEHVRRGGASHAAVELALIAVEVGGDRVPLVRVGVRGQGRGRVGVGVRVRVRVRVRARARVRVRAHLRVVELRCAGEEGRGARGARGVVEHEVDEVRRGHAAEVARLDVIPAAEQRGALLC